MNHLTHQMTQAYDLAYRANQQMAHVWTHDVVFTWRWWIGVFLLIAPWAFWYVVRPRKSVSRMLFTMFFVIIVVSWLDFIGSGYFGLWHYYYEVLPFIPAYIPWDFAIIPVLVALFIQFKPTVSPLVKAAVFGGSFAYVGEPLFTALKMYEPERWRHIYSFFIMMVVYLLAHVVSKAKTFSPLPSRESNVAPRREPSGTKD